MEDRRVLKLLVIDDERPVCRALERLFFGFAEVDAVSEVARAWKLLEDRVYDAILCDLNMPRLSGTDLYDRLAAEKPGAEKKLIFITGGLCTSESREFFRQVDNPVVYKPFDRDELAKTIEDVAQEQCAWCEK